MSDRVFFDTNVLVYSITESGWQTDLARTLLSGGGEISIQVLNEVVAVARRKLHYDWPEINEVILGFRELFPTPHPLTIATHEAGIRISSHYGLSVYDSMIVASAIESRCRTLYSEDMQSGQLIEGAVMVVNPFA